MDVTDSEENMLLLMDQSSLEKSQETASNQQYVQLSSAYGAQQLMLQNNCDMDIDSLDDLLASQGITLENGELPMIEQDGRQYILLPNVSVAQVIENNEIITTHQTNGALRYDQPIVVASLNSNLQNSTVSPVNSSINLSSTVGVLPIRENVTSISVPIATKTTQSSSLPLQMDICRLVPSLFAKPKDSANLASNALSCHMCNFTTENDLDLDQHMEEHRELLNEKVYNKSKSVFMPKKKKQRKKNGCRLIRSVAYANEQQKGPFLCSICGIQISLISAYKRHMKEHLVEKEYKCDICSKSFNIEANLTLHKALHPEFAVQNEGGYVCPACNRTFARFASLKAHLPLHFHDETVICPECGDEFALKSELEQHMDQHKIDVQKHISDKNDTQVGLYCIEELFTSSNQVKPGWKCSQLRKKANPQQCMYCDKVFHKESLFKRHLLIHTGEKPFTCEICKKTFNQASALKTHKLIHSGEKPYSCPHCPQVFSQRGNRRLHISRVHSSSNCFACLECSCTFQKLSTLNGHITKYHCKDDNNRTNNDRTNNNRVNENSLVNEETDIGIQHLLSTINNEQDNFNSQVTPDIVEQALQDCGVHQTTEQSDISPNSFVNSSSENKEGNTEVDCSPVSSNYSKLLGENQTRDKSLSGKIGDIKLSRVYRSVRTSATGKDLSWRVRRVNGIRWHQCMYCTKEFKKPSDLVRHIRTHTNERPYTCKTCKKSFAVKTTLTAHEKIHLGYKPYKCQICSKCFSTSGSLKIHTRLHTGARPFKCSQCDMRFRTTGHRHQHHQSHMRGTARKKMPKPRKNTIKLRLVADMDDVQLQEPIHVDDNGIPIVETVVATDDTLSQYACKMCEKRFKKSCHLQQHMKVHSGEKPFICTKCGTRLATASALKSHLLTHTEVKPFKCSVCGHSFLSRFSLNRHMTTHSQSRPYMCPYCRKTFKTNASCKKHIQIHRKDLHELSSTTIPVHAATIDTSTLFNLADTSDTHTEDQMPGLPIDQQSSNIPCVAENLQSQVTNPLEPVIDLIPPPNVLHFDKNNGLTQMDLGIPQEVSTIQHYNDRSVIDPSNITGSQNHHNSNQLTDVELSNQFYQVDQVLNFKCSGCSKYFETKAHLQRHEYDLQLKKTNFTCTLCCHSLENEESLSSHILSHSLDEVHRCPVCFVGFHDPNIVSKHKSISHPVAIDVMSSKPSNQVQKDEPKKKIIKRRSTFYRLSKEQNEILENTNPDQQMTVSERILLSAVAEKDKVSHALRPGMRGRDKVLDINGPTHPNVCQYCPKSFRKKTDLIRHVRTHTGDKPYKCTTCGKCFAVKSTLTVHEKCHLKKKTYRCHICDTMYAYKSSLKVHMSLHTGAKPYKCPHCSEMFRTPGMRKHHMARHFVEPNKTQTTTSTSEASITSLSSSNVVTSVSSATNILQTTTTNPAAMTSQTKNASANQQQWSDMSFITMDNITGLLQESDSLQVPVQIQGQNISIDGTNITLQFDSVLLQNLQDNSQQQQQQQHSSGTTPLNWPTENTVLPSLSQPCIVVPVQNDQTSMAMIGQAQGSQTDVSTVNNSRVIRTVQHVFGEMEYSAHRNNSDSQVTFTVNPTHTTQIPSNVIPVSNSSVLQPVNHVLTNNIISGQSTLVTHPVSDGVLLTSSLSSNNESNVISAESNDQMSCPNSFNGQTLLLISKQDDALSQPSDVTETNISESVQSRTVLTNVNVVSSK